jgi:hypothetical protein
VVRRRERDQRRLSFGPESNGAWQRHCCRYAAGMNTWWSAGISFVLGFTVRMLALYRGWEEPLAKEPAGVYQHTDGRSLLGRKLAGRSVREMHDLGLTVNASTND